MCVCALISSKIALIGAVSRASQSSTDLSQDFLPHSRPTAVLGLPAGARITKLACVSSIPITAARRRGWCDPSSVPSYGVAVVGCFSSTQNISMGLYAHTPESRIVDTT